MPPRQTRHLRLPYMPGLDGLRAVAVLAVMAYHANLPLSDGGFLGVEVFFVLSGYLITSLLLLDWLDDGRLNYGNFWLRRARRLLPALWLLLLLVPVLARLVAPDALYRLREDVPAALAYVTNWVYILRKISYFEQFGRPPLLRHLWSLAVEEQFYLTWPLIFTGLMLMGGDFRRPKRLLRRFVVAAIALALASAAWRAYLYVPYTDPSRPYYGTDTRAAAILFGAAFAALWQPHVLRGNAALRARSRRWAELLGWGGLAGLLVIFARVNDYTPFLYYGGFLLVDAATLAVIAAVAHPDTTLGRLLGHPLPRWVGMRSYGIYIWHWPIFAVLRPGVDWPVSPWVAVPIQFGLTFAIAEASYRWLEHPIRKGGFRAYGQRLRALWETRRPTAAAGAALAIGLLGVNVAALAAAQPPAPPPDLAFLIPTPTPTVTPAFLPTAVVAATPGAPPTTSSPSATATGPAATALPLHTPSTPTPPAGPALTVIGDSVLQSAVTFEFWKPWGSQVVVDAKPGRRMKDLLTLVPQLAAAGKLAPVVVIHLGTNAPFDGKTMDAAMQSLLKHGARQVFFLNVRRPVRWEDYINDIIARGVARWPQAHLLDWHALALQHPEWFVEDHTHLRYYGTQAYVQFIVNGVAADLPPTFAPSAASPTRTASPLRVTIIGDSVLKETQALHLWQPWQGQVYVDAQEGRQMKTLTTLLPALARTGKLAPIVVIHLGTNSPFPPETVAQTVQMLQTYGVRQIYFVNVHCINRWQDTVNATLAQSVSRWPQVHLLDWHTYAADHPDWFGEDDTHLSRVGAKAFVAFIAHAVGLP